MFYITLFRNCYLNSINGNYNMLLLEAEQSFKTMRQQIFDSNIFSLQ